jgi:3-phosphoshikimate 1-carboxyvinyltransferase
MTDPESRAGPWRAPRAREPVEASVVVPVSKSLMARALVLASLAHEPTTLHNPLVARDSLLMADALRALGARVHSPGEGPWVVEPGRAAQAASVDCGLSGTVMRFVPPLAALAAVDVRFDGDPRARLRPMSGLLTALSGLGVRLSPDDARALPFTVHGTGSVAGGPLRIDARESSQYVSGLLLAGCRFSDGLGLQAVGVPPSTPHVDMTVACLRDRGVDVQQTGSASWHVPVAVPAGGDVHIEPDLSNAAPFLAAALVTGGRVQVRDWPVETTQPGAALLGVLRKFGASVQADEDGVTVTGPGSLAGLGTIDLRDVGELVPTFAAVAALAQGPTTITGVGHLRGHETDRLAALTAALNAVGSHAQCTSDTLIISPGRLHGATVASEGDHRMATFAAILGLCVDGVLVDDVTVTSKTMPDFPRLWQDMLT